MVKSTRTQRLRERVSEDVKRSKQATLDSLPQPPKEKPADAIYQTQKKAIEIADLGTVTREDELVLKVAFKLLPSRASFSRVTADFFFDGEKIDSMRLRVLQGPLATDCFEFSSTLDMTGIPPGLHEFRVEMYELWGEEEKLNVASREITLEYVPVKREDRLVRVPIVKSAAGADLSVVSGSERLIYREVEEGIRREAEGRRDHW